MIDTQAKESLILGQKYAFATVSLILGICSFVNLLGLEKPILAVVFGWLALRAEPGPLLTQHRVWAKTGVTLGTIILILVPVIIILNFDRLREFIDILSKLGGGR
ncbi:MAG TPA: hypothetical protein VJT15_23075 [Pyrinomonadaceae bacterium]|nr:hypothetical protein [Pyrinomonadaceae bacterium]